jgi:hypothetical protein
MSFSTQKFIDKMAKCRRFLVSRFDKDMNVTKRRFFIRHFCYIDDRNVAIEKKLASLTNESNV